MVGARRDCGAGVVPQRFFLLADRGGERGGARRIAVPVANTQLARMNTKEQRTLSAETHRPSNRKRNVSGQPTSPTRAYIRPSSSQRQAERQSREGVGGERWAEKSGGAQTEADKKYEQDTRQRRERRGSCEDSDGRGKRGGGDVARICACARGGEGGKGQKVGEEEDDAAETQLFFFFLAHSRACMRHHHPYRAPSASLVSLAPLDLTCRQSACSLGCAQHSFSQHIQTQMRLQPHAHAERGRGGGGRSAP